MKPRALFALLFLAVLTALPTMASAAFVHYFDCDQCHRADATWNTVDGTGVCITCHNTTGNASFDFGSRTRPDDGATSGVIPPGFASGDASAAFGNNVTTGRQNSHNWGAKDYNLAAGATPASSAMYNSRRGASRGFVSCYKCHDPHTYVDADYLDAGNEKMLRTAALAAGDGTSQPTEKNVEAMCVECHSDWSSLVAADRGLKSHPMIPDYAAFVAAQTAGQERYKSFVPNGDMKLLNDGAGATKVGCSTCHGLHGADSVATTATGIGTAGTGDGKLLRGDGVASDATGNLLCTSCHLYMGHPSSSGPATELGCLVCHSGHSYNDGTPNYFILRSMVNIPAGVSLPTAGTTVGPLRFTTLPATSAETAAMYVGAGGDDGYCTGCHGAITATGPGMPSEIQPHTGAEDCSSCHAHFDPANPTEKSWVGKGCNGCHGYPPSTITAGGPDGYASDLAGTGHDYNTNNGGATFLNEANTPHATHASTNPVAANIDCKVCHNAHVTDFATQHNNGTTGPTFQNVLEVAYAFAPITTGTGAGALTPSYVGATTTCASVYCHSNGNAAGFVTSSVIWNNGATTGEITGCAACHDDNTSGIGAGTKGNSAAHAAHVTRYDAVDGAGSSCNICHSDTTDGLIIDTPANHVNGTVQLATDSAFVIDTGSAATLGGGTLSPASCAVYCHSDGNNNFSNPSWGGTAACGSCHSVDPATIDTLQVGGAHVRHLTDPNGPMIASCNVCHTHDGSFAPNNGHIDKSKLVKANACDACHGKPAVGGWTAAGTVDESPTWTVPATVRCDTCHTGTVAVINAVPAPLIAEAAYANGHGKVGVAQTCTACHEANTVAGHLLGATVERLRATLPAYAATDDRNFCNVCHTTVGSVNNHNVNDGTVCQTCHAQHGEANGNDAMIKSTIATHAVTGFTAQGVRSSYVKADFTGVCQACHNTTTKYFSPNKYEDLTHNPGQACSDCHQHDSAPAFTGAGDSCDSCHGYPPATAAHAVHAPDSFSADALGKVYSDSTNGFADVTACAHCHTGADQYTYSPSADQASQIPGRQNHNVSEASQDATLLASVGYDTVNGSCALACHLADNTRANWATGFAFPAACDACHGNAPATGGGDSTAHVDHISAGLTCTTCHGVTPVDASHIIAKTGLTELIKVTNMTDSTIDAPPITEASWNVLDKTCNNALCHNPTSGAYLADWTAGTGSVSNCVLCHANAPATGAHAAHTTVTVNTTAEDRSDCAQCHTGADSYTYAHRNGAAGFVAGIADAGTAPAYTCSTACHSTTAGKAATWTAASLSCDSCHGGKKTDVTPIASGKHSKHLAVAANDCNTCHQAVIPTDTVHSNSTGANEGATLTARATAVANNAEVLVATWDDINNTCANAACHNPSGTTYSADWDSIAVTDCTLCHSNTDPGTGSHSEHISLAAKFNANGQATCADCHTVPVSMTHLNSIKEVNGAKISSWTNPNCSTSCHSDGITSPGTSPNWGTPSPDCTICHTAPPETGDHPAHLSVARVTAGMTCNSCHSATSADSATAAGAQHMDATANDVVAGGTYNAVPVTLSYTQGTPSSCATANCHASGGSRDWAVPTTCEGCHSNLTADTTHAAHINITTSIATDLSECVLCHGADVSSYGMSPSGNHQNSILNFEAGIGIAGTSPNQTCSGACHSTTAGQAALWSATSLSCDSCHGNAPATGGGDGTAHADHITAGLTCASCHDSAGVPTDLTHITDNSGANQGAILTGRAQALASEVLIQEASWNVLNKTCNTTSCHNPSVTTFSADWTAGTGSVSNCALCHDDTTGDPGTGSHTSHLFAGTLYGNNVTCAECHTVPASNAHRDGTKNVNGSKITTWTNPTCTTSCHANGIAATGTTPNWGVESSSCGLCHLATPSSGSHTNHLDNFYVADCSSCHAAQTATTHINGTVTFNASVVYDGAVPGTCSTNNCHATGTADWTDAVPTVTCTDCHTPGKIGGGVNDKTSGLHIGPLTVSATTHDNTIAGGCAACHVTVMAQGTHIDGTFAGGNGQTTQMGLTTGIYVQTADNTGTCANACHSDGGAWSRKWSTTARNSNGTECANCHGDFTSGFVTGIAGRHQTTTSGDLDGQIESSHDGTDKCLTCHTYNAAGTYYNWGTQHNDGNIQINNGVGFSDNGTTVGCSKCHSATDGTLDEQHEFADTTARWPRVLQAGPAVSCASCHAYPPTPADGKTAQAIESKGAHAKHVTHIAARAGVTLDPAADTFTGVTSAAVCGVCHDVSTDLNHSTAGGTRELAIPVAHQFGITPPAFKGTVGDSSSITPKTCSSVDCHFKETPIWAPVGGE